MAGIIVSTPPSVELPPGSNSGNPVSLPGVTYQYAVLNLPQTWTAKQTFPQGNISLYASDVIGVLTSIPAPTTSTLGGVFSKTAVSHQFLTQIGTDGTPASAQPSFSDISGNLPVTALNSGTGASIATFWRGDGTWAPAGGGTTRTLLVADTTIYVGANLGACTITIASPAVITKSAHGLSANDPVVFQVPINRKAVTITAANPGVVSLTNAFVAGQPVSFDSTGTLPAGLAQNTTYYVISAGLSGSQFEVATTVGGSAINTTALTNTFVNGNSTVTASAAHNLKVGQIIRFAGTSVINVANATDYYVLTTPLGTTFTFSATNGGSAITPGAVTTQGTLAQTGSHFCSTVGALPTGITGGLVYYVISAGLTTNTFEVSATVAGSAVNTSGSVTGSPIYTVRTGNDSNPGTAATRAGAWLTIGKATAYINSIDLNAFSVTAQLADGFYIETVSLLPYFGRGAQGHTTPTIQGNSSIPSNVSITSLATAFTSYSTGGFEWLLKDMRIAGTGAAVSTDVGSAVDINNVEFDTVGAIHLQALFGSFIELVGPVTIVGGGAAHFYATGGGRIVNQLATYTVVGVPVFTFFAGSFNLSYVNTAGITSFAGSATGQKYTASGYSVLLGTSGNVEYFPGNSAGSISNAIYA